MAERNSQNAEIRLTPREIMRITPRNLLRYLVTGIISEHGFSMGIMLDVDQADPERSLGTGKERIARTDKRARVCAFLRNHPNEEIRKRCPDSDCRYFDMAKRKTLEGSGYAGEAFPCDSLGLMDFVVPIYEKESKTFIGVVFGCQKRPLESDRGAERRLREFIEQSENQVLKEIRFNELLAQYLEVGQASKEQIDKWMEVCRDVAVELAGHYKLFVQLKKEQADREKRERAVETMHRRLIDARDLKAFWEMMPDILEYFEEWLRFDWGFMLRKTAEASHRRTFAVVAYRGRGAGHPDAVRNTVFECDAKEFCPLQNAEQIPGLFRDKVQEIVSEHADSCAFPIRDRRNHVVGVFLFGSAPRHPHTECRRAQVQQHLARVVEVVNTMSTEYRELQALEQYKSQTDELSRARDEQLGNVQKLQNALLSLSHQLHRPLWLTTSAISSIRDSLPPYLTVTVSDEIKFGMMAAEHGSILSRGIASALAIEQGGSAGKETIEIDVKTELTRLAKSLRTMARREDLRFHFFDRAPTIKMD